MSVGGPQMRPNGGQTAMDPFISYLEIMKSNRVLFVVPAHQRAMSTHVLVPFDGSDEAERGLERTVERYPDATVTVLTVVDPLSEAGRARADAPLDAGPGEREVRADGAGLEEPDAALAADLDLERVVEVGKPAETIVEYAEEEGVDEIVMGTAGRSGISRLVFGSVGETVARHADRPVTLVE